jgi:hypothetical protein
MEAEKNELEKTRDRMLGFLVTGSFPSNKQVLSLIKECLEFMVEDAIKALIEELPEQASNENQIKVLNSLQCLESVYWNTEFDQNASAFSQDYTILAFNWNDNLAKNAEIEKVSVLLTKLFSMKMSMEQLLMACRHLLQRVNEERNYAIPVSILSKNYLEKLLGEDK